MRVVLTTLADERLGVACNAVGVYQDGKADDEVQTIYGYAECPADDGEAVVVSLIKECKERAERQS